MVVRKRKVSAAQIAAALEEFGRTRHRCALLLADLPILGPHAKAVTDVMHAIDAFADLVTGDRAHFHARICSPPGPPKP
ncbi:hypothetical protein [Roseococcus pinisoli]|uniref:Uncharacterized protein n=1 Tax=Roseococcus pinisoli TaxID=2835040 RepID=A0ABS5QCS5_9PROT|nr:hypothetical protein [Roseococcus pinisoli]MBS7811223.1 hypothetical protein [Roseococcus pinisoli]